MIPSSTIRHLEVLVVQALGIQSLHLRRFAVLCAMAFGVGGSERYAVWKCLTLDAAEVSHQMLRTCRLQCTFPQCEFKFMARAAA